MNIIPAIDIANGKCVRLKEGVRNTGRVYFERPRDAAEYWLSKGADFLHVVDLDGAFEGSVKNWGALEEIISTGIGVQFGGGLRRREDVLRAFDLGAKRVVLGTALLSLDSSELFSLGETVAAIDCKQGVVQVKGWVENAGIGAAEAAVRAKSLGAKAVLVTDVSRDGLLNGPNVELVREVAKMAGVPAIASGGVSCIGDLQKLKQAGASAAIVGTALYEKKFSLGEAQKALEI